MTATEAEQSRRRGLAPWWRVRSWRRDLDTLTRLHKGLRAMDADAEQEFLSAPALLAPPAALSAPQDLMELPQNGVTQQHDVPELPAASNRASLSGRWVSAGDGRAAGCFLPGGPCPGDADEADALAGGPASSDFGTQSGA